MKDYCDELGKGKHCCCSLLPLQHTAWEPWGLQLCYSLLQHCVWQPCRFLSEPAISWLQTHCCGRAGSSFPNSAVNCSTPITSCSQKSHARYLTACASSKCCCGCLRWYRAYIWLCCGISCHFLSIECFNSFKQNLNTINFQQQFLLTISFWNERLYYLEFQNSL